MIDRKRGVRSSGASMCRTPDRTHAQPSRSLNPHILYYSFYRMAMTCTYHLEADERTG